MLLCETPGKAGQMNREHSRWQHPKPSLPGLFEPSARLSVYARPCPARRSASVERLPLELTGLQSQRETGATRSRRKSYFFMSNTLPPAADRVRNAEKKYL